MPSFFLLGLAGTATKTVPEHSPVFLLSVCGTSRVPEHAKDSLKRERERERKGERGREGQRERDRERKVKEHNDRKKMNRR